MTYAGDMTPQQAWDRLEGDSDAVLVDVRTRAEWSFVGLPDLTSVDKQVVPIEWTTFPDGALNQAFLEELRGHVPQDATVIFLCRSGARSVAAATTASQAGYAHAYNVLEGFEGEHDAHGHRAVNGWKNADLPWRQG